MLSPAGSFLSAAVGVASEASGKSAFKFKLAATG